MFGGSTGEPLPSGVTPAVFQRLLTLASELGDEAFADAEGLDPDFLEDVELDPSLDPTLQVDDRELEEVGAELDDPEQIATLDGLIDDPDGLGGPSNRTRDREQDPDGWDLDAPIVPGDADGPAADDGGPGPD